LPLDTHPARMVAASFGYHEETAAFPPPERMRGAPRRLGSAAMRLAFTRDWHNLLPTIEGTRP
jgi:hypothetical protein